MTIYRGCTRRNSLELILLRNVFLLMVVKLPLKSIYRRQERKLLIMYAETDQSNRQALQHNRY